MEQPLWSPSAVQIGNTQMTAFMEWVNDRYGLRLHDYQALHHWSVAHSDRFWFELWDFTGILASSKGMRILEHPQRMPGARWFPDARLNFAENLLRRRDDHPALVFRGEQGERRSVSYAELYRRTAQLAAGLKARGVGVGDRVAGFMPNCIETVVGMLATASLGALWSSCSPDFGIHGVVDRFGQIRPKVLLTADGYRYNGKRIELLSRVKAIVAQLEGLEATVVVPFMDSDPDLSALDQGQLLEEFIERDADRIDFEQLPFDHPLYVMYSSGTTGVPKCIVHSAGGTLIQHLKEHRLHTDLGPSDTLFYFTTCGWMMWNWLVSGLATGATPVLYDGSPFAPEPKSLMDMAEQEGVSIFGTSAKYLAALEKAGVEPRRSHDLSRLRAILSTGSPLAHESFDYVYRGIKPDLLLASISGGTDIISCFALGCPIRPVYRGELQCLGLGMDVRVFDEQGRSLPPGQKGELVCVRPFPSMPIQFWDDADGQRFHRAYFDRFDNIWAHGDYAELTEHGGLIIHGRSDAVLNPGGVRIGTAEIYRQVEKLDEVLESICVGQPWRDDVRVVLFVRLREGLTLDDELRERIRQVIRANTTPRHVPAKILQVADIPRTISGKIVELAVRRVIQGEPVTNQDALANPEALEFYRALPELQRD